MYKCEYCNFETERITNYNRHLKTNKHLVKVEICTNDVQINTNDVQIIQNIIHSCNYCNSSYTKLSSLNRHKTSCVKQILENNNKQLKEKDKQLDNKDKQLDDNAKLIKELKQQNNDLNNIIHKINNKQINVLHKNLKPSNNNNSQIIINNYPNAPNIGFPDNIPTSESLNKYIQMGHEKGIGKFIYDGWAKNINPIDRSIWMVDPSRNKFIVRINNAWVIDIDGKQFQELNIKRIYKIFDDHSQTFNPESENYDQYYHLKTMEFIVDIKTKNMIVKGLKESGKYLVYDKEKYMCNESVGEIKSQ